MAIKPVWKGCSTETGTGGYASDCETTSPVWSYACETAAA